MELINTLLQEADKLLILFARFTGLFILPIFNARNIPTAWKASFVIFLTYFGWVMGLTDNYAVPANGLSFALVLVSELLLGILLSVVTQFFFAAIQLAGQLIDTQMGFGIVNVMDPLSGAPAPILGNFKYILTMLVFLQVDGHHLLLKALYGSYNVIPIGEFAVSDNIIRLLVSFFGEVLFTGLQLALPVVGSLLVVDIVMGIISRTVPQMNIFMVGMPAKILFGFAVLLVTLPLFIYLLNSLIEHLFIQLDQIMRVVL